MTPVLIALALGFQTAEPPPRPPLAELIALHRADAACALFNPARRALLEALIAQARDDQVRAGARPEHVETAASPAPDTAIDCDDPELTALAAGHDARADALERYSDIVFPGVHRNWSVDRGRVGAGRQAEARWRIAQRDAEAQAWFGVFELNGELRLGVAYNRAERDARAGLMFRDAARQRHPLDFTAGGLLPAPDGDPAASWGAGADGRSFISANGRLDQETAARLAPAGGAPAHGFSFSMDGLTRLAALTPREGVAVELRDMTGRVTHRFWFEIGALRAAMALQAMPVTPATPATTTPSAAP